MDIDGILGVCTAVSMAICGICAVVHAFRDTSDMRLRVSRSDPDLESLQNIAVDSLPTHK